MPFLLTLLYLFLAYMSPAEIIPAIAPLRPMLILSIVGMLATLAMAPAEGFRFDAPQIYLLLLFTGMIAFSVIAQGWFGGAIIALEQFTTSVVAFFMVAVNASKITRVRAMIVTLILVSLYLVFQSHLAVNYGFGGEKFVMLDWHYNEETGEVSDTLPRAKAAGFLADPNDLAQNFLVALAFLTIFWKKRRWFGNLLLVIVPGAALLYGVQLTHSRGALIGLAVMVGLALKDRMGRVGSAILAGGLLLGLLLLNFAGGRGISMQAGAGRLEAWSMGIQMLKGSPIWGVGYGGFTDYHNHTAHNSFVLCFAELGLVGYFFWLGMIVFTAMELHAIRISPTADPELKRWATGVRLALFTFLATSWFLSRTYMPTLYVLIGLGVAVTQIAKKSSVEGLPRIEARWFKRTVALQLASVALIYVTLRFR